MELTVGKLKEFLNNFNDDDVVVTTSSNYELRSNLVDARVSEDTCVKKKESFRDDFDGTNYNADIYRHDPDGKRVVRISG